MQTNRKPCTPFFMVNLAGGMNRGRARPKTTTTSRIVTAILQLIGQQLFTTYIFDIGHPCDGQNKKSADKYPMTISRSALGLSKTYTYLYLAH